MKNVSLEPLEEARVRLQGNLGLLCPFDLELAIRVTDVHPLVVPGDDQALHRDFLCIQAQTRNQGAQDRQ